MFNKKIISKVLLLSAIAGTANANANANVLGDTKFYVGGELGYNKMKYGEEFRDVQDRTIKSKIPSLGVLAGTRFNENFGLELGYGCIGKANVNEADGDNFAMKFSNMSIDALGYAPIISNVNFVGALGVGKIKLRHIVDINGDNIADEKYHKVGLRLGAGAEYKFSDNLATRAMLRYQRVGGSNDMNIIKHIISANLGFTYTI